MDPHRSARAQEPALPEDVTGRELDRHVRGELGTLSKENATQVARHLVMTFRLLDEDPATALQHALAAQRRAGRVGLVREAAGLAAYRAGDFEQALRELRTARRLTGTQEHLPVMADCERGLGRPERALALAAGPEANSLDRQGQVELVMVAAGARLDLGQHEAALATLQVPELRKPGAVGHARLLSAYADALEAAGRPQEAREWLERAAAADVEGETGAAERLGIGDEDVILDVLDDVADENGGGPGHETETPAAAAPVDAAVVVAPSGAEVPVGEEGDPDPEAAGAGGEAGPAQPTEPSPQDAPAQEESATEPSPEPASDALGQGVLFSDAPATGRPTDQAPSRDESV